MNASGENLKRWAGRSTAGSESFFGLITDGESIGDKSVATVRMMPVAGRYFAGGRVVGGPSYGGLG
jgi:hypothetical protein